MDASLALIALAFDAAWGYPQWLFRAVGHPVSWMGALIARCETTWNGTRQSFARQRMNGVLVLLLCLAVSLAVSAIVVFIAGRLLTFPFDLVVLGALAGTLVAQRSLYAHVSAVATALDQEGLDAGRRAVSMLVGRDPSSLDEHGVARAAIESLAENFSDGVVAPAFWLVLGGLPGVALYKTINTADSMIGHKSDRYLAFGWGAARLDDLVNLPASRLSALLLFAAAAFNSDASAKASACAVLRDARHHRSPNAGWPEAATAGALGLRLAGPRVYDGVRVPDHWMGEGRVEATAGDIRRALRLYRDACWVQAGLVALIAALLSL